MIRVKIGEYKVGDKLFIDYGEDNPNNQKIEIRGIIDMEVVIFIDDDNNYHMGTIKYFNLLCRYGNLFKIN